MPPIEPPKQAILIPNTQSMYCQFHNFCCGGVAAYRLARGPAQNLWVSLCPKCAEEMFRLAPDRLIRVCVEGAVERDRLRFVHEPLARVMAGQPVMYPGTLSPEEFAEISAASGAVMTGIAMQLARDEAAFLAAPPSIPSPLTRAAVLAYLEDNAEDPELLAELGEIFGDGEAEPDGQESEPPAPADPVAGAPASVKTAKSTAKASAPRGAAARKVARRTGRK